MEDLIKLAIEDKWDELFDRLGNEPPLMLDKVINEYCRRTNCDDFGDSFTTEQRDKLRWLDSGERRLEYYKKIPIENMTAEEYSDFKACSW